MPRPALIALAVGACVAGVLAATNPAVGLGLAIIGMAVAVLLTTPLPRLGRLGIVVAAVAAIVGPNLAVPGAPSIFAFRVVIVLLGLGAVGYLLMGGTLVIPRGLPRAAGLLMGLVVWSGLSIFWSHNTAAALRWTLFLAMMGGLAIGIALACRRRPVAIRMLIALGVTFTFATALAIAELRLGIRLPTSALAGRSEAGFATSLFGNQNNFATYLSLTLPYFLCLPIVFNDARLIALGAVGGAVTLGALLFTGSRSNLIATFLVFGGLILTLATDRRRRGRLVGGVAVTALAAILVIPSLGGGGLIPLPQTVVDKFDIGLLIEQQQNRSSGSGAVRGSILDEGLALVADSGGLGVGAGNAETSVRSLANFTGIENLHNWWLEVLVNLGVVGFALYLGLFLTLLRGQLRASRRTDDPLVRWLGLAGGLSLIGFVVGSLGPSSVIHFAPMWITFGLGMLTLVMAHDTRTRTPSGPLDPHSEEHAP